MVLQDKTSKVLAFLPNYLKKNPTSNNHKFITSFSGELEDIADEISNLNAAIQLSTAQGSELDSIGELFLLPRKGSESDADYRGRIKAFWPGFSGGGTIPSIKETIARLTDVTEDEVTIVEFGDSPYLAAMKFKLIVEIADLNVSIDAVREVANNTKAAGAYIIFAVDTSITDTYGDWTDSQTSTESPYIYPDFYLVGSDKVAK